MKSYISTNIEGKLVTVTVVEGEHEVILSPRIHITEKCNYQCGHCYVNSNPYVTDILSKEEIHNLVDQLAEHKTSGVLITGGEPFLHPDLDDIISYFRSKQVGPVSIFTNGSWVSNYKQTKQRLKELKRLGCEHIKFSINDQYHRKFIGESKGKLIKRLIRLNGKRNFPAIEFNSEKEEVNPQGNALNLPQEQLKVYEESNEESFQDWNSIFSPGCSLNLDYLTKLVHLNIRASGEVYPCGWFVRSLGNIRTDALSEIVDRFFNDEEYRLISEKGPQEIARRKGMSGDEIYQRFLEYPCKFCYELFND